MILGNNKILGVLSLCFLNHDIGEWERFLALDVGGTAVAGGRDCVFGGKLDKNNAGTVFSRTLYLNRFF